MTSTTHCFKESSSLLIPENLSFKQVLDNAKNIIINIQILAYHPPCFKKQRNRMKQEKGRRRKINEEKGKRMDKIHKRNNEET